MRHSLLAHPRRAVRATALLAVAPLLAASLAACADSSTSTTGSVADDCTPAHTFDTVTEGTLTVAADVSLPYVDVDDSTGALGGVDGVVLTKIAEMECLTITNATIHGSTAIGSVQQGKSDLAAGGWYRTAAHGKVLGQTVPVYYDFTAVASADGQYDSLDQLEGKTVGVTQGSLYVSELQDALGKDNVKQYETLTEAMTDLKNGRIDATIAGSGETGYQLSQLTDSGLDMQPIEADDRLTASQSYGEVNFPHTQGNTDLTTALDEDIETLREDGTVQDALDQYGLTNKANFSGK
ncbi:transporter substrate-binding domain-containing protein [Nocardioides sp. GY 10127]|uniref:substrate-binding periplasmic protein n=1 Tax=Nocardioides sp. GY 10127 TaxID=2569762 RepID=UPI0010A90B3D|nr:transporter substrate-binding domain-containing protein [Nocardioides sp. GY 10127]TIC85639.1 amino acid ABC transporter substrate-binding protein [Nocardioides sp. GY 10127]